MISTKERPSNGPAADRDSRRRLVLLVTDSAPRSQRARTNLAATLSKLSIDDMPVEEIDLIDHPAAAVEYRVFATPALIWDVAGTVEAVLYGDLSDRETLVDFLRQGP